MVPFTSHVTFILYSYNCMQQVLIYECVYTA